MRLSPENTIRVFPRETSYSPNDPLAFFGGPPLFALPDYPVYVSVLFTWDIARGKDLASQWSTVSGRVFLGGPALGSPALDFESGLFTRGGVTITSRGCPKHCPFCLVHEREGGLQELPICPGHIVNDNNLLACSRSHIESVFDMLAHEKGICFKGGLDADYLERWHVDAFGALSIQEFWFACDSQAAIITITRVAEMMKHFPQRKKRCYVLIGRNETITEARNRCQSVFDLGFLPFAQLFKPVEPIEYSDEWKQLQRHWSRPAIYRSRVTQAQRGLSWQA